MKQAKKNIADAKNLLEENRVESSINRSSYAIFHAIRAVAALDGFDSYKHSGTIASLIKCTWKEDFLIKR